MTAPVESGTGRTTVPPTATYVFAICRRPDKDVVSALPGLVDGSPVRMLAFGALAAVVQDVPTEDFCAEAWQRRLNDPTDLERCARAHHQVVCAVGAVGPTLPLALATLYHDDERARRRLTADTARFEAALGHVEGRVEWGVKVYAPHTSAEPTAAQSTTAPGPGSGRAYLAGVRRQRDVRRQLYDEGLRAAEQVDSAMRELAVEGRRLRCHGEEPTATGGRRTQVLNAAYLVEDPLRREVASTVESLRRRTGMEIEVSGPWIPYSFAGAGGGDARD
ncbi:GvpL/GvpF family gas vesicle protein [Wenjunlia tyrosinilytica]|jgi:hypothetical protein|uniref:Gas vesicle protein n=1 Tax=Wenjunlia tyrosinilytica TaxID=1544741 RepID=A0A917ZRX0_9ACTN|nr:GvpL/GvpF family gas vesicle protein [Wenjunlia tyrosinilytica]GGO90255.1 gas vesicle protein [Wenjunlia tyrosinilytica]